ncbi:hypothetical protein AVEN_162431-1 [Araneus ventricosus]|uniref:Uncharacterized protein n=1 Tax=Araneus ventricosus TaxID=182803 RepID=A0A4Y2NMP1_ARAVE|nr:hypothetical protein AVEN_162431-1 [Araneus ventricosus]
MSAHRDLKWRGPSRSRIALKYLPNGRAAVVSSQLRGWRVPGSKLDSVEEPPYKRRSHPETEMSWREELSVQSLADLGTKPGFNKTSGKQKQKRTSDPVRPQNP